VDLKAAFTQKIGPLPAIAWAGMAGGVFVVIAYVKRAKTPAPMVNSGYPDDTSLTTDPYGLGGAGGISSSGGGGGGTSATDLTPNQAIQTNQDWARQTTNYLIALGMDPIAVTHAITTFLYGTGEALNSTEAAMLATALRVFGQPPDGAIIPPPIQTQAPTVVTPAPAPAAPAPATPNAGQTPGTAVSAPAGTPIGLGRPNLTMGSTGEQVQRLQVWLNTYTGANIPVTGTYDAATEAQMNNLYMFLNHGQRDVAQFGSSGVNTAGWGLLDYLSELKGGWRP
jgi:hypothetical protein